MGVSGMPEPMTRTEYSIAAPGLRIRERVSREFAEALAALVPGGRVVVRQGRVVPGRRGAALRWSRWHDAPKQPADQSCPLCGTDRRNGTTSGTGDAGAGRGVRRTSGGRGLPGPACSVVLAPAGAAPYVFAHERVHRSPTLEVSANGVQVEIDLEGLPAGAALGFLGDLRGELDVFAAQWKDWAVRAEMDRAGPYPIPPLIYGGGGESREAGPTGTRDDVRADGVRDSGDVPGAPEGGE